MINLNILETNNPFTTKRLLTATIEDLNDLRKKIELLEVYTVFRNDDILIIKEETEREDSRNDL